jgi:ABC-type phosphate transport system substrate-binding protein
MVSFKKLLRELFMFLVILHPSEILLADELKPKVLDSNGKAGSLSQETIREIFFMRLSSWPDGSPIRVFVLPDNNPIHVQFAKEVLGVYPFQLRSAWDRLVYSGTGVAPTTVETQEEMKARIEGTPGGIGYIGK